MCNLKKKALVIGINYDTADSLAHKDYVRLTGSRKDAIDFRRLLVEQYGYTPEDVTLLVDHHGSSGLAPTRQNIIDQIKRLVRGARAGDSFVFYYAGHSGQIPCLEHTEDDDMDEVILPMDHDGIENKDQLIVDNDLRKLLVNKLPPGARLTAVFDSCHSGTLLDLDHYHCNVLYHPWISKGVRDTKTRHVDIVRRDDTTQVSMHQDGTPPKLRKAFTLDSFLSSLGQGPKNKTRKTRPPIPERAQTGLTLRPMISFRGRRTKRPSRGLVKRAAKLWRLIIPRCTSPQSERKCDGNCVQTPTAKPHVISLSACTDSQTTWECGKKGSMTQALIELLRPNPHPTLKQLGESLIYKRYDTSRKLHEWSHNEKKKADEKRRAEDNADEHSLASEVTHTEETAIEMVNFSDIQIGSQEKLDWDEIFTF